VDHRLDGVVGTNVSGELHTRGRGNQRRRRPVAELPSVVRAPAPHGLIVAEGAHVVESKGHRGHGNRQGHALGRAGDGRATGPVPLASSSARAPRRDALPRRGVLVRYEASVLAIAAGACALRAAHTRRSTAFARLLGLRARGAHGRRAAATVAVEDAAFLDTQVVLRARLAIEAGGTIGLAIGDAAAAARAK
jgi:hypothetical protein